MAVYREAEAPELALVMPIFNEAANIRGVVREWVACLDRLRINFVFLAVNDGSIDGTAEVLENLAGEIGSRFRLFTKSNSGHGRTCRQGYEAALAEGVRWICQVDSDGQCDPTFFPGLYTVRSDHDCVFAYRQSRDDGWGRVAVSLACRMLLWFATGKCLRDPNVPYRLIRAGALRAALRRIPPDFDLQNIALSYALRCEPDLRWQYVPIHFRARRGGKNSINYRKIMKMGLNLLRDFGRIRRDDSSRWYRPGWTRRRAVS